MFNELLGFIGILLKPLKRIGIKDPPPPPPPHKESIYALTFSVALAFDVQDGNVLQLALQKFVQPDDDDDDDDRLYF